jgi:hypothetical protein
MQSVRTMLELVSKVPGSVNPSDGCNQHHLHLARLDLYRPSLDRCKRSILRIVSLLRPLHWQAVAQSSLIALQPPLTSYQLLPRQENPR